MTIDNNEGIRGWFSHLDFGIYRVSYITMRLTGVALLIFFVYHVIQTGSILEGRLGWAEIQKTFFSYEWRYVLVIVGAMAVFHTINGIRLMITQTGHGIGKPRSMEELAIPSKDGFKREPRSINKKNRTCIYASIGIGALFAIFAFEYLFSL